MWEKQNIFFHKPSNRDEIPLLQPKFYLNNDEIERKHSLKILRTNASSNGKTTKNRPFASESLKLLYFACIHLLCLLL